MFALKYRTEERRATAKISGGSTSGRMNSGSISTFGICGTSANTRPTMVISTGCGIRVFRASGIVTTEASSTRKSSVSWPTEDPLGRSGRPASAYVPAPTGPIVCFRA